MIQICDIPIVVLISMFLTNFCYDFILAESVQSGVSERRCCKIINRTRFQNTNVQHALRKNIIIAKIGKEHRD